MNRSTIVASARWMASRALIWGLMTLPFPAAGLIYSGITGNENDLVIYIVVGASIAGCLVFLASFALKMFVFNP